MPTKQDYETARALALQALSTLDVDQCCVNAGLFLELAAPGVKQVRIPYLGNVYTLTARSNGVAFDDTSIPLKVPDQVLLLHYLITASGMPVEDSWITFREVPSGSFYYAAFVKRAIAPLKKCFGKEPSLLRQVAQVIGQAMPSPGDIALRISALPRVPVALSLWKGDEEFPPEANLYFDQSIPSYLSTEDIAYLAGAAVYRVIGIARQLTDKS